MKVANYCKETVKTERQWNELGFKPLKDVSGERMWTNQFCGQCSIYFRENEVEKMTAEEFEDWKNSDRKKKNERAKESRKVRAEEQKRLEEQWKQEELAREREWQKLMCDRKNKLDELKDSGNLLAVIRIGDEGHYIYEVPNGSVVEEKGVFPFGNLDEPRDGKILWFVDPEDVVKEEWFPYGLKAQKILKFRPHKGSLDDAMQEAREFNTVDSMFEYIVSLWEQLELGKVLKKEDFCIGSWLGPDERIGWKACWAVCTYRCGNQEYNIPQCIGMCSME